MPEPKQEYEDYTEHEDGPLDDFDNEQDLMDVQAAVENPVSYDNQQDIDHSLPGTSGLQHHVSSHITHFKKFYTLFIHVSFLIFH